MIEAMMNIPKDAFVFYCDRAGNISRVHSVGFDTPEGSITLKECRNE